MMSDIDFLKSSSLTNYFNISKEVDTFLLCLSLSELNTPNEKVNLPITDDMFKSIKKCELIMLNDYLFFEMNKNISQSNKNNFDKVFGVNSKKIVEKKKILSATTNKFIEKQDFSQSLNINNAYNKANENNKEDRINNRIQSSKKSKIEIIDQVVNDGRKSSQMKSQKIDIEMKEKDENNNILINKEIKKDNKVLNEIINEIQKEIIVAKTNKIQKHEVCAQFNLNININQEKKD